MMMMRAQRLLSYLVAIAALSHALQAPLGPQPHQQGLLDPAEAQHELSPDASRELLSLHRSLVEIESITGNERDVGRFLVEYLEAHNFTVETHEVAQRRFNVLAYVGSRRETKVLVTSHMDTVPPYLPYNSSATRHGTLLGGRGAVDAKACIAAQITAARLLVAAAPASRPPSLSLLFVVGEETGGAGMRHFSARKPAEYSAVVFGEPTAGALAAGHKGNVGFALRVRGRAAHSGYPWLGYSAVAGLVRALGALAALEERGGLPRSDKYGNTTVNVGRIRGGVAANVVAEEAEADVAVRIAAEGPDAVRRLVEEAVRGVREEAEERGGGLELVFESKGYGPVDIDHDVEGFEAVTVNYGTDIPWLEGRHKRYLYGPGSILVAHSDHEHLTVRELERAVVDYKRIILATLDASGRGQRQAARPMGSPDTLP